MRVPSREATKALTVLVSAAKVAEAAQDLERLLLGLHQRRRVGPDPIQRVRPLGPRRALRVKAERGRIEEDAFAGHLLDHGALGKHVLERIARGQPALDELEPSEL